jgi:SAM-dependent methyltransferase
MPETNAEYARLRQAGQAGWGGEGHARRRDGWISTIARLQQDASFPAPPARLLELGCGNGAVSALFARQGYEVEGIERSTEAVAWAGELFETAGMAGSFRQGDVCAMPFFGDGRFDAVIDGNCLHCVIGADRARCLAEVKRVLQPSGAFVVSSMCGAPKSDEARARYDARSRCLIADGRPYRSLIPADEIAGELRRAGFRVVSRQISENAWWDHLTLVAVPRMG